MPTDFIQYLVIILVALLFGKEYLLTPILKKWGISVNGKNGNGNDDLIKKLSENHLHDMAKQSTLGGMNGKIDVLGVKLDTIINELREIKDILRDNAKT